jgi:hypothetical protein
VTKTDEIEQIAQAMAETTNGGDFNDGRWYSDEHRDLWRKRAEVARAVMTVEVDAGLMRENMELAERVLTQQFERHDIVAFHEDMRDAAGVLLRAVDITCTQLRQPKRRAAIEPETHEWLVRRLRRAHDRFVRVIKEYEDE